MSQIINEYYVKPIAGVIQNPRTFFCLLKKDNTKRLLQPLGVVVVSSVCCVHFFVFPVEILKLECCSFGVCGK